MSPLRFTQCCIALTAFVFGCQSAPSDVEHRPTAEDERPLSPQKGAATVEQRGRGFRGQMIIPRGEIIQHETAQINVCNDDDCGNLTRDLLSARRFFGSTCADVRKNIGDQPLVDIWGARARVICNGDAAQAMSSGPDGKMGTCDDLGITISVGARTFQ